MGKVYGVCRISTKKQNIDRQVRNILAVHPDAIIFKEVFTGTKVFSRKELNKVLQLAKAGDIIVFDEVSRMSRNAEEGIALYFNLFDKNIDLEFLKEPQINTQTYRNALGTNRVAMTGDIAVDELVAAINNFFRRLAERQIRLAFEQAEAEVTFLHKRTAEGLLSAKLAGKQVGGVKGKKLNVKKAVAAKSKIQELSKDFDGSLSDVDLMAVVGVSRNTFYKYKREIIIERAGLNV
ncbi:MAG: recombinase family protein [Clostridia bacterium]|nr:recombinase family protein [Clostridia bacterium]